MAWYVIGVLLGAWFSALGFGWIAAKEGQERLVTLGKFFGPITFLGNAVLIIRELVV